MNRSVRSGTSVVVRDLQGRRGELRHLWVGIYGWASMGGHLWVGVPLNVRCGHGASVSHRRAAPRGRAPGTLVRADRDGSYRRSSRLRFDLAGRPPPVRPTGRDRARPVGGVDVARRPRRCHRAGRARSARRVARVPRAGDAGEAGGDRRCDLRRATHPRGGRGMERAGVPRLRAPVRSSRRPLRGGVHDRPDAAT